MHNVVITDTAEGELRLISEYLAFFGAQTASSFISEVQDKVSMLKDGVVEFPLARDPDLVQAGFHVVLVKSYLMLYSIADNGDVNIAHVFHQSQDYANIVIGSFQS